MGKDFKQQVAEAKALEPRVAIPALDPEAPKATVEKHAAAPGDKTLGWQESQATTATPHPVAAERPLYLSPVTVGEQKTSVGTHMYPSRQRQLNDLAHYTGRKPWEIIEDALEEYVIKHYGKEHRRK